MNKPNIHNNIIGCISSFQNGFSDLSSTGFFSKYTFLRLQHFFSLSGYPINSVPVHINKIHAFDKAFILLISECLWISNFSRLWHVARSSRPKYAWHLNRVVLGGQVKNKIHISTCRRCMDTKLGQVLTKHERIPNITLWLSDKSEVTWPFEKSVSPLSFSLHLFL